MRLQDVPLDRLRGADGILAPKGLVLSMKEVGLLNPILVAPVYASDDYQVIAGRKRVAAARELGWSTIPVQISAHLVRSLLPLHENLHRAPSPALEARIIGDLLEQGMSQRQVAKAVGISQAQVSQRRALLSLAPGAMEMLDRGELKPSIARALAKLPQEQQTALLAGESHPTLAQVQACRRQRKLAALADLPLPPSAGPQPPPEEAMITNQPWTRGLKYEGACCLRPLRRGLVLGGPGGEDLIQLLEQLVKRSSTYSLSGGWNGWVRLSIEFEEGNGGKEGL